MLTPSRKIYPLIFIILLGLIVSGLGSTTARATAENGKYIDSYHATNGYFPRNLETSNEQSTWTLKSGNEENNLHSQQLPTINILNPTDNDTIGDFVTIRFNISSENDITALEIYLNDTLIANISTIIEVNGTYYFYLDVDAKGLNGTYILKIRAMNQNGWGETSHIIHVDPNYKAGALKILSYNILETGARPEWKDVIKEENPDIAILIETGLWVGGDDPDLQAIVNEFNQYFTNEEPYQVEATQIDKTSTAGETILSRYPIVSFTEFKYAPLDDGTMTRLHHSVFDAVVEIAEFDVHFIGVHLACCESGLNKRIEDMEAIINYMDSLGNVPIVFAGDFNSHSPEDVGDLAPNEGNLGTEPIEMLINKSHPHASTIHAWYDAYRILNPTDPGYTYVDNIYQSRIDYIFVNQYFVDYVDLLVNSTVADTPSGTIGSDHYPVDVTINLDSPEIDLKPPFKPTGLKAQIINSTTVQLTWNPNSESDLAYYNIYRNGEKIGSAYMNNFTDSQAPPGEILRYQISAVDDDNNEGFKSNTLLLNTTYGLIKQPSAPNITLEVSNDSKKIIITWSINDTGGIPIKYFKIYRLSGDSYIYFARVDGSKNQFIDTRIVAGRTYTYRVSAVNEVGEGPMSEPRNITVSPSPAPAPTYTETTTTTTEKATNFATETMSLALFLGASVVLIQKRKNKFTRK